MTLLSQNLIRYGISEADYELMLDEQAGVCAICGKENPANSRGERERLSVDHCHRTNEVRGLLCRKCNAALGQVDDNLEVLSAMIAYIKRFVRVN